MTNGDLCFFVWFDSLCPINNLSVIKKRVFLGWTSTKLGLMFLLKDTTQWRRWGSNPRPFGLESSTLPLSHCAPKNGDLRDRFFYPIFTWIMDSFSCSPLFFFNFKISFRKSLITLRCSFTWWPHFNRTMTSRDTRVHEFQYNQCM